MVTMAGDAESVTNREVAGGEEKIMVTSLNDWHSSSAPGDRSTSSANTLPFTEVDENAETPGRVYRSRSRSRTRSRSFVGRYKDRRPNALTFGIFTKSLIVTFGLFLVALVSVRLLICLKKEASSALSARSRRGAPLSGARWRATGSSLVRRLEDNDGDRLGLLEHGSPPPYEETWTPPHDLQVSGFAEIPPPPYTAEDPAPPPSYVESCGIGGGDSALRGGDPEVRQSSRTGWRRAVIAAFAYVAVSLFAAVIVTVAFPDRPDDRNIRTSVPRTLTLVLSYVPAVFGLAYLVYLLFRRRHRDFHLFME
ncbi:hypothetical protein CSUI_007135 [Cystoisospora suis]|uniref:Transmembrane protein n=1 Tax=Cystoisospora suis TaxID=483139 RepID=A0A2C6KS10_9APIC|nr:hypothetical protein CSUI_007135 [Cystoisospora suis]